MTAPNEPQDPAPELGSTAQFKAFVTQNDEPDEARERAAADPDVPRPPADSHDDREIRFTDPADSGPPAQSLHPEVELPPAELGSTGQFRAFARGEESTSADRATAAQSVTSQTRPEAPGTEHPGVGESLAPPPLPPADPNDKRNLLVALAVIALVAVVVALLFVVL